MLTNNRSKQEIANFHFKANVMQIRWNRKCLIYSIPFLLCFFISCNWGRSTDTLVCEQGTDGYDEIILLNGDTMFSMPYPERSGYRPLRRGKFYNFRAGTDNEKAFFVTEGGFVIAGHIDNYVKTDSFLLADRKPLDSIFGSLQTLPCPFDSSSTYLERPHVNYTNRKDRERQLRESPIHDFWIIDQKTSDVYGPMSFDDYLAKKKELNVPNELKLKSEVNR